jgi:DNA-directed RNA polymerase subunit alpha
MLQINCIKSYTKKANTQFAQFLISPLKFGQGITIGNALRRTLLSQLETIAITGVSFPGVKHEFSTIANVKEDIIYILLNIKQIVLKGHISEPLTMRLKFQGPGIITAKDIELPDGVQLVEPRQYIASVVADSCLEIEFFIRCGEGYILSGSNLNSLPDGFLSVDATFMPVRKVNFFIETASSDVLLQTESLVLEILTDGSITPLESISTAAEQLSKSFELLNVISVPKQGITVVENNLQEDNNEHALEKVLIEELQLSVRAYNCLKRENVHTISDLLNYSQEDLLEFKNFGQKSANEVNENLQLHFGQKLKKYF